MNEDIKKEFYDKFCEFEEVQTDTEHWEKKALVTQDGEVIIDWFISKLTQRDNKLVEEIEKMKIIEATFGNPCDLMWKQRINLKLQAVINLIHKA